MEVIFYFNFERQEKYIKHYKQNNKNTVYFKSALPPPLIQKVIPSNQTLLSTTSPLAQFVVPSSCSAFCFDSRLSLGLIFASIYFYVFLYYLYVPICMKKNIYLAITAGYYLL